MNGREEGQYKYDERKGHTAYVLKTKSVTFSIYQGIYGLQKSFDLELHHENTAYSTLHVFKFPNQICKTPHLPNTYPLPGVFDSFRRLLVGLIRLSIGLELILNDSKLQYVLFPII